MIRRYLKAFKETSMPAFSIRNAGRLRTLRPDEELALEVYAYWLIETGCPLVARDLIEDAANRLRARYMPPEGPVSKKW